MNEAGKQKYEMRTLSLLLLGALLFSNGRAGAESFKILGSRPLGMGGAFVAVAEDALAQYWNPAGIARQRKFDVEIPVGAKVEFTGGLLKDVNTIGELADKFSKVQTAQKNGTAIDADQMASLFKTVSVLDGLNQPDKGALVEAQGGFNLRIMRIGVSVNNFTSAGAVPFVDTKNIGLGVNSGANAAGVSFTGANSAAPSDATLIAPRDNVQGAIDTVGYNNIVQLLGSNANLAAAGITNSQTLANALVNQAKTAGLSNQQITDAAQQMKDSAPAAQSLIANALSGNPYTSNTSNVTLRGISLFEIGAGYSHSFFLEDLYLGGNLKVLVGRVGYFKEEFLKKKVEGNDISADFDTNTKQSVQPGVDLGLLYDKRKKYRTKIGLLARNVNFPEFDQPAIAAGEPKYRVQPQVRAGLALYPLKRTFWVVTSDLDLTNNITPVPGFSSRMWGLGTEVNVFNSNMINLALRAGLMKNLAEKDSKLTYTGGFGFKILHFFIDVAGAVSSQREQIKSGTNESQQVPQNAQVGVALGLNF